MDEAEQIPLRYLFRLTWINFFSLPLLIKPTYLQLCVGYCLGLYNYIGLVPKVHNRTVLLRLWLVEIRMAGAH